MLSQPEFRIAQVVQEYSRAGGAETVAFELRQLWESQGVASEMLTASVGAEAADDTGVRFALPPALMKRIPTRGAWRYAGRAAVVPTFTLAASAALRRGQRARGWAEHAVVLSHGDSLVADAIVIHAVNAASLAQKRSDGDWRWALNPMHAWVAARDRAMLRGLRARRYIAVSHRVVGELTRHHGIPRDRIEVIPNGTDLQRFSPDGPDAGLREQFGISADAPILLFVGHEFDRKGLLYVLDALTRPGMAEAHLVAVGAGDAKAYQRLAADRSVSGRVHFTGPRRDLPALYREADAFVFPSAYETFSLVCMEAMACGTPVFACPVGGIEDYLQDGVNGFAVERCGSSIARALVPVLCDAALQTRLAAGASATASAYGWPAVAARYEALMRTIWAEKLQLASH